MVQNMNFKNWVFVNQVKDKIFMDSQEILDVTTYMYRFLRGVNFCGFTWLSIKISSSKFSLAKIDCDVCGRELNMDFSIEHCLK